MNIESGFFFGLLRQERVAFYDVQGYDFGATYLDCTLIHLGVLRKICHQHPESGAIFLMRWKRWIPAILVMILIFCFSSLPAQKVKQISDPEIKLLDQFASKIDPNNGKNIEWLDFGHAIGYILLVVSFVSALAQYPRVRKPYFLALFLCFVYALTDEFHQLFVPGRSSEWKDILIVTSAAGLALLIILLVKQFQRHNGSDPRPNF